MTTYKLYRRQSGFSLIEIMVALGLGAVILLGISEIFSNNSSTRSEIEQTGRQIENAAYALRLLETDLSNASYWGEAGEQDPSGSLPPVCAGLDANLESAANELIDAMGYPIQGADPSLGTPCFTRKPGTDFIAIRRASTCALGSPGCGAENFNFHLQINSCFDQDDTLAPLPGDVLIDTTIADLDYTQRDCTAVAPIYRMLSRVYFLNSNDVLVRTELSRESGTSAYVQTQLVDGIEALRFEYGLDTTGNGQVDKQTNDPNGPITEWPNVAMVRISMVVRNQNPTSGYTDTKTYVVGGESYTVPPDMLGHKRQVYTRTVSIRNVAGRREVQ